MTLCIAAGGVVLALAVETFTLHWTHSVTRGLWWESWEVSDAGLRPIEARITGSGPGMDPPEGALLVDGAWSYRPDLPPQQQVFLAASGATTGGWHLCALGVCHVLGADSGPAVRLWQSSQCDSD
jgi:hypothetical protein